MQEETMRRLVYSIKSIYRMKKASILTTFALSATLLEEKALI